MGITGASDGGRCPGSSTLAMAPSSEHMETVSVSRPLEHLVMDIKLGIDKLDVHDGPLFGSDRGWSCLEITDAMRREALGAPGCPKLLMFTRTVRDRVHRCTSSMADKGVNSG